MRRHVVPCQLAQSLVCVATFGPDAALRKMVPLPSCTRYPGKPLPTDPGTIRPGHTGSPCMRIPSRDSPVLEQRVAADAYELRRRPDSLWRSAYTAGADPFAVFGCGSSYAGSRNTS